MALLAEEIVEEWLNRQGYFTIRGIKLGVHEVDLLAIRAKPTGLECRHVEVQASVRPISYISRVPRAVQQATGRSANSAKERSQDELRQGIKEWIAKKYDAPRKQSLMATLASGPWSRELVVHEVKHDVELRMLEAAGVRIHRLVSIVADLKHARLLFEGAAGAALTDLVAMSAGEVKLGEENDDEEQRDE